MTALPIQYRLLPILKLRNACKLDTKQCMFVLFLLNSYPIPIAIPLLNCIGKPEEWSAPLHPSTIGQVFFPSLGRAAFTKSPIRTREAWHSHICFINTASLGPLQKPQSPTPSVSTEFLNFWKHTHRGKHSGLCVLQHSSQFQRTAIRKWFHNDLWGSACSVLKFGPHLWPTQVSCSSDLLVLTLKLALLAGWN